MSQTMEENECLESEGKISWIWSKAVSVGKKVLTAGVVVSSAPLLFPPLVVASTIAFISSVPFCLFLANYACTQKIMRTLLPPNEETSSGIEKDEYSFEAAKLGHGAAGMAEFDGAEPVLIPSEEDEEMAKESTRMIEKIRDEGRSEKEVQDGEKSGDAKPEKVQDQTAKQEALKTGREGWELESTTTTEASTGKEEETSSNEPVDQAVSAPSGTGEEKRKNTTKKKKKTGRADDVQNSESVYSEEKIWEKMEELRKVVGYSVARSATYAEELKALYVFTGVVEPPQSSLMNQDSHDIANVCVRLRFLMSVIGIN
ncbi:BnaA02g11920D [Brassica napus]|uniref:BnaA02g11920D protein n=1 Tax=Brassica napus TaxID=3708 RepID=A0A078FVE7_BRANA|nr:BnaA02g11920D [Brassica napus]